MNCLFHSYISPILCGVWNESVVNYFEEMCSNPLSLYTFLFYRHFNIIHISHEIYMQTYIVYMDYYFSVLVISLENSYNFQILIKQIYLIYYLCFH